MDDGAHVPRAIQAATVGELAWIDPDGVPQARPVTPLLLGDRPAVALPYAEVTLARRLAAAQVAALVVSDDRLTGRGWRPVAVAGRPRLTEDRDGTLFTDRLLDQELRKYPPARALIDSPLLRREHWWYLPRLIVVLDVDTATTIGARPDGTGEVLAVARDDRLYVDSVTRADGQVGEPVRVRSLAGRLPADGPAVLLGHDFSAPDLERWTPWTTRGELADGVLAVTAAPARTTLAPPLGLWRRLTRQRRLARACQDALDG
ncbi:pyridoxamine 5'-phosphate oxidase family protein [Verrucosispora sp. WMMA2044]|uniref:Pyridoxamine 5'-phosphate oxidase family protein n=1 Tax=Verrucosispora sioxanthis TaxID=2499994 RepID=A0A6M1LBY3_9ACTN|nr:MULTISPECIES: pyridoxamine 5'-phosphate oxidase family protein [Micromonospora]NEE66656.1 pyridoxamine 5'-phosphate oxidase family protein [Verrucosispora sioxanthis]NGM15766.1 pyridoxamine 5'-phosphate oxidase family protein [Verrucosispora sioxanthis]WBB48605.1 pyridoxamine 5'-phosphate oxidase family protein [Verrucosispora sp. WMMA2044]